MTNKNELLDEVFSLESDNSKIINYLTENNIYDQKIISIIQSAYEVGFRDARRAAYAVIRDSDL